MKAFVLSHHYILSKVVTMKPEQVKNATKAFNELSESYVEVFGAVKGAANAAKSSKKLSDMSLE